MGGGPDNSLVRARRGDVFPSFPRSRVGMQSGISEGKMSIPLFEHTALRYIHEELKVFPVRVASPG